MQGKRNKVILSQDSKIERAIMLQKERDTEKEIEREICMEIVRNVRQEKQTVRKKREDRDRGKE